MTNTGRWITYGAGSAGLGMIEAINHVYFWNWEYWPLLVGYIVFGHFTLLRGMQPQKPQSIELKKPLTK